MKKQALLAFVVPLAAAHLSAELVSAAASFHVVALTGEQAPNMPNGVIFDEFKRPDINAAGEVAFAAVFAGTGVLNTNDSTLWSDRGGSLMQVVREGQQAVGLPMMVSYGTFPTPHLNDEGHIAFESVLSGVGVDFNNDEAVFSEGTTGALGLVAHESDHAAGTPAAVNYSGIVHVLFNNEGRVVFSGQVKGTGVDNSNSACIWTGFPGAVSLVVRENEQAPTLPVGIKLFTTGTLVPVLGGDDRCAFFFGLDGTGVDMTSDNIIYGGTTGTPAFVIREGNPAPGTPVGVNIGPLLKPQINDAGQTAIHANLSGNVDASNKEAIFSEGQSGVLALVARTGDPAPVGTFTNLNNPLICADGTTSFTAVISGSGIDDANDECICVDTGGALRFVAREGDPAPGLADGVVFAGDAVAMEAAFSGQTAMNAKGQVAFHARVDGPGIDATNNKGLWVFDPVVGVRLIIQYGEDVEVASGDTRTVQQVIWASGSGGSDGRSCGFNDAAQLALWIWFNDGSQAIIVTTDSDGDGTADVLDNCLTTVNADQADSDGDGVGDACDDCPNDANKTSPGACGCQVADGDSDGDGVPDCFDACPNDPDKQTTGACGCGTPDIDSDGNGIADCNEGTSGDPNPGQMGDSGDTPPEMQQCCGGGLPVLMPFMLLGWRKRRTAKRESRLPKR